MTAGMTIARCRELISQADDLTDEQLEELRSRLYLMADVIADVYTDLCNENIDPGRLEPPGTIDEQLERLAKSGLE